MALSSTQVSRFAPAHLNRQAICIMSAMGMDDRALLSIFKSQIHHAEHLENDFRSLDKSRHPAKHVYKNAFLPIAKMIKCDLGDQVLLQNVIQCIKCQLLRDLKYKAVREPHLHGPTLIHVLLAGFRERRRVLDGCVRNFMPELKLIK
jgi:RNA-dependent RNA polymerase